MAKTYLKPISIPSDTDLSLEGSSLIAKGKLGEMSLIVDDMFKVEIKSVFSTVNKPKKKHYPLKIDRKRFFYMEKGLLAFYEEDYLYYFLFFHQF